MSEFTFSPSYVNLHFRIILTLNDEQLLCDHLSVLIELLGAARNQSSRICLRFLMSPLIFLTRRRRFTAYSGGRVIFLSTGITHASSSQRCNRENAMDKFCSWCRSSSALRINSPFLLIRLGSCRYNCLLTSSGSQSASSMLNRNSTAVWVSLSDQKQ